MKIKDVIKSKQEFVKILAFRPNKETYDFIKKHNINIRLLVEKAVEELQ